MKASSQKLSICLEQPLYEFVDDYQIKHNCKSRSAVISKAIRLLQQIQLENHYRAAETEIDTAFEITTADGLEDETW